MLPVVSEVHAHELGRILRHKVLHCVEDVAELLAGDGVMVEPGLLVVRVRHEAEVEEADSAHELLLDAEPLTARPALHHGYGSQLLLHDVRAGLVRAGQAEVPQRAVVVLFHPVGLRGQCE